MTTTNADNLPRDSRGKWRRQLANVERDAEAARLSAQGWSYSRIAEHLGYSDKGDAHRGARRALSELALSHGADELRRQQVEGNKELRSRMWEIVLNPPPLTDRVGRPVHDDHGQVVPDAQAITAAANTILKCDERLARLTGIDAPKKSVTWTIDTILDMGREWARQQGMPEPGSPETRAWVEGKAPLQLADGRRVPPVTAGQLAQLAADTGDPSLTLLQGNVEP